MFSSQSGPHIWPGVLHAEPAWGMGTGQPAGGVAQAHWGGSIGWQIGYPDPP
jgi:hypothetical protein